MHNQRLQRTSGAKFSHPTRPLFEVVRRRAPHTRRFRLPLSFDIMPALMYDNE